MLRELAPAATRSVANLDVSVSAFRTTIDREFTEAARLHQRASKTLAAAVGDISDAAERLKANVYEAAHGREAGHVHAAAGSASPVVVHGDELLANGGAGVSRPR